MNSILLKYRLLPVISLIVLIASSDCAIAAVDMFLNIANISGESTDQAHSKAIDVISWSFGMGQGSNTTTAPSPFKVQDIRISKYIDSASPLLAKACITGEVIPSADLTIRSSSTQIEYLKIFLSNVVITSLSSGGGSSQDRLSELVTLNFEQYRIEYTKQNPDGTTGQVIPASYNIKTGSILDVLLKVALAGTGSGSVNSITQGVSFSCMPDVCPPQGFPYNTSLTLAATPSRISISTGWAGACTIVNENCQVMLNADKNVSATFVLADKARIGATGYESFAAAYDSTSGAVTTILLLTDILPLSTLIDKILVLEGGYNADFSRSTTDYTTLQGRLTIHKNGTLTADRIIVR